MKEKKIGEETDGMVMWSAYTKHTLSSKCNNTTQDNKEARKATIINGA